METFRIIHKSSLTNNTQVTYISANNIKEAVHKLKELQQDVVVLAFMQE